MQWASREQEVQGSLCPDVHGIPLFGCHDTTVLGLSSPVTMESSLPRPLLHVRRATALAASCPRAAGQAHLLDSGLEERRGQSQLQPRT